METKSLGGKIKATNGKLVGDARKEKNFQTWLEGAQVKVLKGQSVLNDAAYTALLTEVKRIMKNRTNLAQLQAEPASNFAALQLMADTTLKGVTREKLVIEAQVKAGKKKSIPVGGASDAQVQIIDKFYGMEAKEKYNIITNVRAILAAVGGKVKEFEAIAKELQVKDEVLEVVEA